MSESNVISLSNLALRLCGEAPDGKIADTEISKVAGSLISYIVAAKGELSAFRKNKKYPRTTEELLKECPDGKFWQEYEGIPLRDLDWATFSLENADSIYISKANFEAFLKNNENSDQEKRNLKELYERNQPWSDYEAKEQTIERLNRENASLKDQVAQLKANIDQLNENIPAYLDKTHRHHSPKLEAAVEAWKAIFHDPEKEIHSKVKRIEGWLDRNRIGVANTESIIRVVNPTTKK